MMHATLLAAGISEEWGKVTLSFIRFCLPLPPQETYILQFKVFIFFMAEQLPLENSVSAKFQPRGKFSTFDFRSAV